MSTAPPPSYTVPDQAKAPGKGSDYGTTNQSAPATSREPLLSGSSSEPWASGSNELRNDWAGEGEMDDIPEDFKIGMTVSQSSQDVRNAFVRKVYGVLFIQILGTAAVGALMSGDSATRWVRENSGLMLVPMFGTFIAMFGVFWKRHSHPLNLILLGVFTLFEAITVGSLVSYFDQVVVLQALIITSFVFVGLTLFTFQSKYDFSKMGGYLFAALLVFVLTGFVGIFIPYSKTTDMVIAGAGCMIFSLYIVYDTHMLLKRLHVDDWVLACISLYLDVLNLFISILRLLSDIQDR